MRDQVGGLQRELPLEHVTARAPRSGAPLSLSWNELARGLELDPIPGFEALAGLAMTGASLGAGRRILSVEAGPGGFAIKLGAAGGDVVCTESWTADLADLRRTAAGCVNIRVFDSPSTNLPLPDHGIDEAFFAVPLGLRTDRQQSLRELKRVLAPAGALHAIAWNRLAAPAEPAGEKQWLLDQLGQAGFVVSDVRELTIATTAPSRASLLLAEEAIPLRRGSERRARLSRINLVTQAIEETGDDPRPVELTATSYVISART